MELSEMFENDNTIEQDGNDKICLFLGAKLTPDGTKWVFDEVGTNQSLMKCPPFGLIQRCTNANEPLKSRIMRFHEDFNWLMIVIKECSKKTINPNLEFKYNFIKTEFFNFSYMGYSNVGIIHRLVVEFIDEYNKIKDTEKEVSQLKSRLEFVSQEGLSDLINDLKLNEKEK